VQTLHRAQDREEDLGLGPLQLEDFERTLLQLVLLQLDKVDEERRVDLLQFLKPRWRLPQEADRQP